MKKANLNSVYVVRELKKNVLLLITVEKEHLKKPLPDWWLRQLDELSETCDIMFIFPKGSQNIIKCDKFTNLCSGHAWIVGDWRKTLLESLEYSYEVLKTHAYYVILSLENVSSLSRKGILNLMMKQVKGPIFKIWRKSCDELYNYYRETSVGKEIWIKFPKFWRKENLDKLNFYSLWTTKSKFLWINRGIIPEILEYAGKGMIDTYETIEDFFGSGIKVINPSTFLNKDIEYIWDDPEGKK